MTDAPTAEQESEKKRTNERRWKSRERAERHAFFALATVFGVLALVAWRPQSAHGVDLVYVLVVAGLPVGGMVVWAVGTFLALPLAAFYERRDKKHEGWGPVEGGGW
ncbi:MAG TPA: hypothetical protein VIM33_01620 [Gaiellaceae bacterium]|jgi:polyferredoxin